MTLKNIFYPQSVEYRYVLDSILRNNHFNPHQKKRFSSYLISGSKAGGRKYI